MTRLALAASSRIAAEAGERIARDGGNAVDAAVAAILVSMATEPGVIGLGAGGFVAAGSAEGKPRVIDGYVEMPGRGLTSRNPGTGCRDVHLSYGGGVDTHVGAGTVGTPGALAALEEAWRRWGRLPWSTLVEPAVEWARNGFPLPQASHNYLIHAHELVFGRDPRSRAALHGPDGTLLGPGETVRVEHLAETLELIAAKGTGELYGGDLGRRIADEVQANDGLLTLQDLEEYQPVVRTPLVSTLEDWRLATNPPPAIGGVVLSAMLRLLHASGDRSSPAERVREVVKIQEAVLGFRLSRLDPSADLEREARELLEVDTLEELARLNGSPSTVQSSAVDVDGLACSISVSTGYSSGIMPPGTGIWLNNCVGEIELNPRGLHADAPGTRLRSNMAPTVGRRADGSVMAIASPGADRITTALLQVLANYVVHGMELEASVAHPRVHMEWVDGTPSCAYEEGIPVDRLGIPSRGFDDLSMFFGGVGVAVAHEDGRLEAASDPRRAGGTAVV